MIANSNPTQDRDFAHLSRVIHDTIRQEQADLIRLSQALWDDPEGPMDEHRSSRRVAELLNARGFEVTEGVGGLPTAFSAEYGTGDLTIVLCAEYDALEGFTDQGFGHACGHNLIAATSVGAGLALKRIADEAGIRVRVVGTPGEEGKGGKILLMEQGVFDGANAVLMAHGAGIDRKQMESVANTIVDIRFVGLPAHASASPHRGINALDSVVTAYNSVGLARQQMPPGAIENVGINSGGPVNVIPDRAVIRFMLRHADIDVLKDEIEPRIWRAMRGAAEAHGTAAVRVFTSPTYAATNSDARLVDAYERAAQAVGRSPLDNQFGDPPASTDLWNVTGTPADPAIPGIHPLLSVTGRQEPGLGLHSPEMMNASNPRQPGARDTIAEVSVALALTAAGIASGKERAGFVERSWSVDEALKGVRPAYLPEPGWNVPTVLHKGPGVDQNLFRSAQQPASADFPVR